MSSAALILGSAFEVLAVLAIAYAAASLFIGPHALALPARPPAAAAERGAVAILKPLHGAEGPLRHDLESFFREAGAAAAEIRLGLAAPADPALPVARALAQAHPEVSSRVIVEGRLWGENRKISNLLNMVEDLHADVLVLADSDIWAPAGYLETVLATLEVPGTGVVTCPYYGKPCGRFWSRIAAMGLSYQFLPSVLAGVGLGLARPCMGSTIALRRETLEALGGLGRFADVLADDYAVGAAVRDLGLQSRLAPVLVAHSCTEATIGELFAHELRWARTVRGLDPLGHAGSLLTHPAPLALAGVGFLGASPSSLALLAAALGVRFAVKGWIDRAAGTSTGGFWLLPFRDIVSALVFAGSFFGRAVEWRGQKFHVTRGGDLRPVQDRPV